MLRIMLTGAAVQVLTGNGLIAANRLQGNHVVEAKMVVKLALAIAALTLLILAVRGRRSRRPSGTSSPALTDGAAGLGIAAVLVAVVWT
ncbi:hypothetical protein [Phytoactinopolyspora mesophila]|uniref:Uncharacterized protein n=1 Tax=Phytoactinopolyspora mesophila TaxID=2650750 RepID=A0A7K3M7Q5_9ACTN|nr:hypothetical protein [Phytoactinopolyspora mesophila]NDL58972.1 hypothetical protein [Phytoactinopolyspora mesophila]